MGKRAGRDSSSGRISVLRSSSVVYGLLLALTAFALGALLAAAPAVAMTGIDDCDSCHPPYNYWSASHYHLHPDHRAMPCYSLCHFTAGGAWGDYLRASHEADENRGADYLDSDHYGDGCGLCHQSAHPLMPQPHTAVGVEASHQSTTTGCEGCHSKSLIRAHDAYPTCGVCHQSSNKAVKQAISTGDTSCHSCHAWIPADGHDLLHDGGLVVEDGCSSCHVDNISNEHGDDCAMCHSSTRVRVVDAIEADQTRCTSCHPGFHLKTWSYPDYYAWDTRRNPLLMEIGENPYNPGVHGNYLASTAKCGICHSVHRARADGVKLLNTADATCAGCHSAGVSTITAVVVSWQEGGPHGSGDSASCLSRSCHLGNPHGAGGSQYKIVAAKLLSPEVDAALATAVSNESSSGIGLANLNAEVLTADGGWDEATRSAVRTGYTCNQAGCHVQTMLTVLEKGWAEQRLAASGDPEEPGAGPFVSKTGHLSRGTPDGTSSFTPVTGCVSCHDQTDSATAGVSYSTVSGYTFPHSQTPTGVGNTGSDRAWLWMTIAGNAGGDDADFMRSPIDKAKDGACLKCHRDVGNRAGIGLPPVGTIVFAWTATPGSWAEYFVHDSNGNLVSTGVGEYGVGGWTGSFNVTVPVSDKPYSLSILWLDPAYDPWVEYWTYGSALIDEESKVFSFPY